jgi:hypothetical protein
MTANVSAYANTFACQNPGKIFFLCTWQTVMDNSLSRYVQGLLMHIWTSYYPSLSAMCGAKISCLDSDMQMYWHMGKHLQSYLFKYFRV